MQQLKPWTGKIPAELYHGTAAGSFTEFDLEISNGCAWFSPTFEAASEIAKSFARSGRGPEAGVYPAEST